VEIRIYSLSLRSTGKLRNLQAASEVSKDGLGDSALNLGDMTLFLGSHCQSWIELN
jgi:hypothetical protein